MTPITFLLIFIPVLALILLSVNLILAPHSPYEEKNSVFECGFHSFLGQNRTQFSISFFIFGLLFLLFDLEILLVYPYVVSAKTNELYGLITMLIFFLVLTLGFAFEIGKEALKIDSRQDDIENNYRNNKTPSEINNVNGSYKSTNDKHDHGNKVTVPRVDLGNYYTLQEINNTSNSAIMNLSLIIFLIGVLGFVLNRKNIILMLISIEIMLLAITLLILVSSLNYDDILGQTFAIYIISIAGAESAIGLGILVAFYRLRGSIAIEYK